MNDFQWSLVLSDFRITWRTSHAADAEGPYVLTKRTQTLGTEARNISAVRFSKGILMSGSHALTLFCQPSYEVYTIIFILPIFINKENDAQTGVLLDDD